MIKKLTRAAFERLALPSCSMQLITHEVPLADWIAQWTAAFQSALIAMAHTTVVRVMP